MFYHEIAEEFKHTSLGESTENSIKERSPRIDKNEEEISLAGGRGC